MIARTTVVVRRIFLLRKSARPKKRVETSNVRALETTTCRTLRIIGIADKHVPTI